VYREFERISERGGVLGAMDSMYQRGKIQEESLYYEAKKHDGSLPIVGVNTFLSESQAGEASVAEDALIRSTDEEKEHQVESTRRFRERRQKAGEQALADLRETAAAGGNVFASLMETVKTCSLGQISHALYEVGGQYRRNM
ncbi:MAG: methylmalonyl-CoA mutase family protein, partial [Gammaproteobacteria bacterium]